MVRLCCGEPLQEETFLLLGCAQMSLSEDGYPLPATDGSSYGKKRVSKGPCTYDGPTGTWKRTWRP